MLSPQINVRRPSNDRGSARSAKGPGQGNLLSSPSPQYPRSRSNSQASGSSAQNSLRGSFQGPLALGNDDTIIIQWQEKPLEKAPELNLLYKRPSAFHVYSGDCFSKFLRVLTSLCRNFNRIGDSALANYKPVTGRTDHTLEYVIGLAREYAINLKYGSQTNNATTVVIKTPSGSSIKSLASPPKPNKVSPSGSTAKSNKSRAQQTLKNQLLREFYEKAHRTLTFLQQSVVHFRTLVYALTFSRYSEEELSESEAKMVRGKTIVGSCIWIVTYALQQLQEDPEVELFENMSKTNSDVSDLAVEMYSLITLSLHTWNDIVQAINILERLHKRTEEVFSKQNDRFITKAKPESDEANLANVHLREYRRSPDGGLDYIRSFNGFDPYASLLNWGAVKRQAPARILYVTDYTNPESLWYGFDPLTVDSKTVYFKDVLNFIKLVLESVRDSVQKIVVELQGQSNDGTARRQSLFRQQYHSTGIMCYEDGIEALDDILSKKLSRVEWNIDEMHEFFETDKIFLDDLDLLSLGAAVTRTLIFEARHTMQMCYETCRLLDYKEFMGLPSYEKIYHKIKETLLLAEERSQNMKQAVRYKSKRTSTGNSNQFELTDLRNVAGLFRTSQYREILKKLPIYTNNTGFTLQDAEMVFTPSSEKLLS